MIRYNEFILIHTYHIDRINQYHTKTMNKLDQTRVWALDALIPVSLLPKCHALQLGSIFCQANSFPIV